MIYLIGDTHFNHKNIIKYEDRPFDNIEHMNETLIENWNKEVSNKDVIYHLGDFAWGNKEVVSELVSRLNGYKILIKGNHDGHSARWYHDAGFNDVIDGGIILDDFFLLTHKPAYINNHMPYVNIHGHIHSMSMVGYKHFNVSVEWIEYTPILFKEVKKLFKEGES